MIRFMSRRILVSLLFLAGVLASGEMAHGHALQPGYLELRLAGHEQYAVLWKTPGVFGRPMDIAAYLPESCEPRSPVPPVWDGSAYVSRWTTTCVGGLEGGVIQIVGLERTSTDVLVRYEFTHGASEAHRLTPGNPSFTVPAQPRPLQVVQTYISLGVEHILLGIDHLMFVLALLLLVKGLRRIIATITAFTLAHSLTLAAATLGLVHLPGPPIEATIALSIVFVAAEILRSRQGSPGLTERYPWGVALTFGLLHGFGFAGALAEIGLPQKSIPMALLFFNVGVEIGQLLFIGAAVATMALFRRVAYRIHVPQPAWARAVPPYVIGSLAAYWVIQRIAAF